MMSWGVRAASSYSAVMELVIRLTSARFTPSSLLTAFSTWAEQAEQVMPVMLNFCFAIAFTLSQQAVGKFLWATPHPRGVSISYPVYSDLSSLSLPRSRPIIPA